MMGYSGNNWEKAFFEMFEWAHRFKVFLRCMFQFEIHVVFLNDKYVSHNHHNTPSQPGVVNEQYWTFFSKTHHYK